jgi:hypothetical protein
MSVLVAHDAVAWNRHGEEAERSEEDEAIQGAGSTARRRLLCLCSASGMQKSEGS